MEKGGAADGGWEGEGEGCVADSVMLVVIAGSENTGELEIKMFVVLLMNSGSKGLPIRRYISTRHLIILRQLRARIDGFRSLVEIFGDCKGRDSNTKEFVEYDDFMAIFGILSGIML